MADVEKPSPVAEPAASVDMEKQELEEGEIVSTEPTTPAPEHSLENKHPLEHGWTFWFDNPNGKSKQATWGSSLRPVYTFKTVEDFWCLYNNVLQPSHLIAGADFHCFKDGIEPKWEDPRCAQGGKWSTSTPRGNNNKATLDQFWLHTVLIADSNAGNVLIAQVLYGGRFELPQGLRVNSIRSQDEGALIDMGYDLLYFYTESVVCLVNESHLVLLAMIGEQFDEYDEVCGAVVSVRTRQDKIALWTKTASNEAAQTSIGKQWKSVLDISDKIGYLVHEDARRLDKGAKNKYTV
ncbi:hypothetical protein AXG93_3016s1100 [Marchantia polymorpha subsp. ruderalis]|uniref:eIF-4F 25 kDa subunit n=1 Tax=Marchantia polymorpha subsp. ruderalis TaxID=1480154 RepID=A0A176WBP8_MARPO|nr:hypothetical protein AXG93_3016s1100 [Marchantia polymorpha subsp. ruderalis]